MLIATHFSGQQTYNKVLTNCQPIRWHIQVLKGRFWCPKVIVSTERLKWCPMLRQMLKSMICHMMHVHFASHTQTIQSFDWFKWCCALWHYVTSRLLSRPNIISDGPTNRLWIPQLLVTRKFRFLKKILFSCVIYVQPHVEPL